MKKLERIARHLAYIAFFAFFLGALERIGPGAQAFVAGVSVGTVIGSVSVLFFLVRLVDKEESDQEQQPPKPKKPA